MIAYPSIDPVAIALGPVKVHWYGLMYLLGFASAWWLGKRRARQRWSPVRPEQIDDLVFYGALGAVIGGRIGSVIFYNFDSFLQNPLYLFKIWEGGMAFHGGFIGVALAMWFYQRKIGCGFFRLTDFIAPLCPLGLAAGRFGNFINAELWGAPGNVAWAMKLSCEQFPPARYADFAGPLCYSARHPGSVRRFVAFIEQTAAADDDYRGLFARLRAGPQRRRIHPFAGRAYRLPAGYRLADPGHCIIAANDYSGAFSADTREKERECSNILT